MLDIDKNKLNIVRIKRKNKEDCTKEAVDFVTENIDDIKKIIECYGELEEMRNELKGLIKQLRTVANT